MIEIRPAYLNSDLAGIAKGLKAKLKRCSLCPRKCGVNRLKGEKGFCRIGSDVYVYSYLSHKGEEPPISGIRGSGTIFFSGCSMKCVYCQNYKFSQFSDEQYAGSRVNDAELAAIMLKLQQAGCHNINLVTPTHVLPQIIAALALAAGKGLRIPLVYNTSGYELPEIIRLLAEVVDIYLVDMRYADPKMAFKYSSARDYPEFNLESVSEMFRQRGQAVFDAQGIMLSGLIIRHLVLPENISGTREIMQRLASVLGPEDAHISLMSQYLPCHRSGEFKELSRRITSGEYARAKESLLEFGFTNGWLQEDNGLSELAGVNIKPIERNN